jgi:hypothetical protein
LAPCAAVVRARARWASGSIEDWGRCQAGRQWHRGPKVGASGEVGEDWKPRSRRGHQHWAGRQWCRRLKVCRSSRVGEAGKPRSRRRPPVRSRMMAWPEGGVKAAGRSWSRIVNGKRWWWCPGDSGSGDRWASAWQFQILLSVGREHTLDRREWKLVIHVPEP